jgi:hypothetical protein
VLRIGDRAYVVDGGRDGELIDTLVGGTKFE